MTGPEEPRELATVTRMPDRQVHDAEFVTPEEWERVRHRHAAQARAAGYARDVVTVTRVTRTAVTHQRTVTAARAVTRNALYVPLGAGVVGRRLWEAKTNSRYERVMRAAEAVGDIDRLERWEQLGEQAKERRHKRAMNWVRAPLELVKAGVLGVAAFVAALLGLGILLAIGNRDASWVVAPLRGFVTLVTSVAWAVTIVWGPLLLALPWLLVLACWHYGRRSGVTPTWLAPASSVTPERGLIPDEGAILAALKNLNLPPLNKKIKEGWQPRWPMPTTREGEGYRTQLELPLGVNVPMIMDRGQLLAHNLVRLPVEVWPTEPQDQPGILDLWVANPGLLTGPVKPYPLLDDGVCDYFKGVPVGVDQRGDVMTGRLMACNYAIGGRMGSGKTSLVINLVAGCALDPLANIDVYVMAYNVDYDPFEPRLSVLVKGDEDEHVTAAMDGLRDLREDVTQRGKLLAELGGEETKLTRALAQRDPGMRPRLVIFDECQELFRHEKYGGQAKELAIKVMTKARKCGITLVWVTPEPSADSLPRELAKVVSHSACFAIGDHQGNDAILGTGAYKRGISAVGLTEANVGTAMTSGFGPRPGLLRSYHIRKDKTTDQLTPIVRRSLEPWRGHAPVTPGEVRDLLQDVHEALGSDEMVRASDMAARLRELAPGYRPYANLDGADLAELLAELDVEVKRKDGYPVVRADRVLRALDGRQGVE